MRAVITGATSGIGKEMAVLDQEVLADQQLAAGCRRQDGTIVTDAQRGRTHRAAEVTGNQVKFVHAATVPGNKKRHRWRPGQTG